ncbi:MAG: NADH-quinone oxidoreductase subunit H, partial [Candidatus Sulfotelmatobacter sp.]
LGGGAWDTAFSLFPALTFFFLAGLTLRTTVRMPKTSYFKIQKTGLGVFGLLLGGIGLVLLVPPVRDRIQDIYWFAIKVAAVMYMYIWYRGTFPSYRFDQLMSLGWKFMIPTGVGVLIATALVGVL